VGEIEINNIEHLKLMATEAYKNVTKENPTEVFAFGNRNKGYKGYKVVVDGIVIITDLSAIIRSSREKSIVMFEGAINEWFQDLENKYMIENGAPEWQDQ